VPLSACEKLSDALLDREGSLGYSAEGFVDAKGRPGLHLAVRGMLHLRCQRCLERMELPIDSRRDIVLVAGGSEFEQGEDEDDATDFIPLTPRLDLWALAEEEAVLSLPLAPRHAQGGCQAAAASEKGEKEPSPFAALVKLQKT
jgi:uncharacterized protein